MNRIAKFLLIAIVMLFVFPKSSLAIPSGIPSQQCSTISTPRPGDLCYVVHENQGGKAYAGGSPRGGELVIQPTAGYYATVEARSEITSQAGDSNISKRILSKGASLESKNGYEEKLEELDKTINELEVKIAGTVGLAAIELKNKLTQLKEVRRELNQSYQTAISAGKDAIKVQFSWSASPRKCGWANLDKCGSWVRFRVYQVKRYLGDPIAEYNRLLGE
ncbi:MAG: hypothetical protein WBA39_13275 [Rivularia sp. (in: cyanobacteria)]